MKKLLLILMAVATLFVACSDNSSDNGGDSTKTLQEVINSAETGKVLDLDKVDYKALESGEKISIDKALTIKNANVNSAEITVNVKGVTFEKIEGIKTLTIGSGVKDGDFTIKGCNTVEKIYVNGGGSNSIHIEATSITNLTVNKEDVRILLKSNERNITILKTFVLKKCKLESEDKENKFESVAIDKIVDIVELKGSVVVEKLVSNADVTETKITITIADNDIEAKPNIKAADASLKDNVKEIQGNTEVPVSITKTVSEADKNTIAGELVDAKSEVEKTEDPMFEVAYGEGVTVSGSATEAIIENPNYNKNGTVANVWDSCVIRKIEAKSGRNYRATIDLKADRETYIAIGLQDIGTQRCSSGEQYKITTEWQTFSVESGTLYNDWKNGHFTMGIGTVQKLEAKNFKIEAIDSKPTLGREYWYSLNENIGKIDFDGTLDGGKSAKITFKEGWAGSGGVNILFHNSQISVGKICKLSFKIKITNASEISMWLHTNGDEYQSGGMFLHFDENQEKNVTLYTPVYKINEDDSDKRNPDVWIGSSVSTEITVTNVDVSETTVEDVLKNNPERHFAYLGEIDGEWTQIMGDNAARFIQIPVPAGNIICGQFVICGDGGWNYTDEISITVFGVLDGGTSKTVGVTKDGGDFVFINETDDTINLKISLDKQNRLVFEKVE